FVEQVGGFTERDDDLWEQSREHYKLIADRACATLNALYPRSKNFLCIKVSHASRFIGWAVLLDTQMRDNKYFGNMRLGSIVDCLALPENALAVMQAATQFLEQRGVDMIISNQYNYFWGGNLVSCVFLYTGSELIC